jgi:hypothetical protein
MSQAFNLSQFANKVNTSGQADLTTAVTGTLPKGNGGTGLTTPGISGNVLMSDGTDWVSGTIYPVRNRIINGAMVIDQRNAGASVTPTDQQYLVDRWLAGLTQSSKFSVQQNAAAVTPPTGFSYYLGVTSLSSYSVGSTDAFNVQTRIEGFNTADLAWGTANAKTVTLSFWVRSSLTGTFGGNISNSGASRVYAFSYTISVANTWEQKSITIAGDTTGTWLTTNGIGVSIVFVLGYGSSYQGTANVWNAGSYYSPTGATSVVGTNGATFYITGVQLEQNTSATPFERRLYGQELANCQRYYNKWSGANSQNIGLATCSATGGATPSTRRASWANPVDFRSAPTIGLGGTIQLYTAALSNLGFTSVHANTSSKNIISIDINSSSSGTTGQALMLIIDSGLAANFIDASAEL